MASSSASALDQTVRVMAFVGVGGLDLPGGGVMLTAAAAAMVQVMYIVVDAVDNSYDQDQNNNNVCHTITSRLVFSNRT